MSRGLIRMPRDHPDHIQPNWSGLLFQILLKKKLYCFLNTLPERKYRRTTEELKSNVQPAAVSNRTIGEVYCLGTRLGLSELGKLTTVKFVMMKFLF